MLIDGRIQYSMCQNTRYSCGQRRIMTSNKLVCTTSKAECKRQPDLKFEQVEKTSLNRKWNLYVTNLLYIIGYIF